MAEDKSQPSTTSYTHSIFLATESKMNARDKTRRQLLDELEKTRRRNAELEALEAERKQAEEALRKSEERFRTLADFTHDWEYWIGPDGDYIYVSPSCERVTGYCADEFLKDPALMKVIIYPQDQAVFDKHIEEELGSGGVLSIDFRIVTRSGDERWISHVCQPVYGDDGSELGRRASNRDITERKQADDALRQRNRELALLNQAGQVLTSNLDLDDVLVAVLEEVRRLLSVVAASVWLTDPETGRLVCRQAVGPQSETVRGWQLEPGEGIAGWVAHKGESLIVPDTWADERHFKGVDRQIGQEMRSIISIPLRVRKNLIGALQVVDTKVDRFSSADLTLVEPLAASAAIAIDNARLVKMLRQRTSELEARNEELAAFAHTVAHDLKNPLARIVGFSEVLGEEYAVMPGAELRHYLYKMARTGRKMSSIIDGLLLLAGVRQMEVEMMPLDMAEIVDEAQQRLAPVIEEREAEITLPETWPMAVGYAPWVEEMWVNYLSNAVKYGGDPPQVELGGTVQTDGMVHFWVRDNGPGIPSEAQSRLFKPFTRLDQVCTPGHGLGLSIVWRIAERLGGKAWVKSEVGQGSVFGFTLPTGADYE
ncbi:MAG: GAF domain-containing protein [Chloroflexota bacterium]|nr:GAF domain-containing protein [Chloroflexota bacterium]